MHASRFAGLLVSTVVATALVGGCHRASPAGPGTGSDGANSRQAWSGITPAETLRFTGTEPFWGGQASGASLTWREADDAAGTTIAVTRFSGRNGIGLSGTLQGAPFDMAVSPEPCRDGMSDRNYPYSVIVARRNETLRGCGWNDAHPFTGPAHP